MEKIQMRVISNSFRRAGVQRLCGTLLTVTTLASVAYAQTPFTSGEKAKVKGTIMSRKGDLVKVQDTKTGTSAIVKITDDTRIVRNKSKVVFRRRQDMDVPAVVPCLTINVEVSGNSTNQLEANKITFSPDEFAIEVAQKQQI